MDFVWQVAAQFPATYELLPYTSLACFLLKLLKG